jgi:hypothetical protein
MTIRVAEIKQGHLQLSDDGCTAHPQDDEHNRKDKTVIIRQDFFCMEDETCDTYGHTNQFFSCFRSSRCVSFGRGNM